MTTQIIIDFDNMPDEQAATIAAGVEAFINRQFPAAGMHGSIYTTDDAASASLRSI